MKKLFYQFKYYWHLLKVKELSLVMRDCIDENLKHKLEQKIDYHEHEKAVLNYIVKP
ncbi:hypothetical protein [Virgibacillus ndiopensis]|uniref:hypothetical protein n=1 Tax=Virgibacillus ndiopensis TaxID=2004408 RepID=UPI00159BE011|nr:hypothetical protein [Virgibacillus ndiopensis]